MACARRQYKSVSSEDKNRILAASRSGESVYAIAKRLGIKYGTAKRIAREDHSPERRRGHRSSKLTDLHKDFLRQQVNADPTITLKKLKEKLFDTHHLTVSISTIDRHLDGMQFSLKKLIVQPQERNNMRTKELRHDYAVWLRDNGMQTQRIYIDETNYNIWVSRSFGRSRRGVPATMTRPSTRGANLNIIAAIDISGLVHFETHSKVSHLTFNEFLLACSQKVADRDVVFILDNAPCHKRTSEVSLPPNHAVKYLPPYSPMFNPIEEYFSSFKAAVKRHLQERKSAIFHRPVDRSVTAHRFNMLKEAANEVKNTISSYHCANFDRHQMTFIPKAIAKENL